MQPPIKNVAPGACKNGETAAVVDVEAQFETAVLRLKTHLSGWGAPFADIEDEIVREIAAIMRDHWLRGKDADA